MAGVRRQPHGGLTAEGYAALFDYLGIKMKGRKRALPVVLSLVRYDDGVPYVQIGVNQLAREAFGSDRAAASRALNGLVDDGVLDIAVPETATTTRVYRVAFPEHGTTTPEGCGNRTETTTPESCQNGHKGLSKQALGVAVPTVERTTNLDNHIYQSSGGAVRDDAPAAITRDAKCPQCGAAVVAEDIGGMFNANCGSCGYGFVFSG